VPIVVNSGPLISLARIGRLDLLPELFGEITVPAAVYQEVTRDESLPGAGTLTEAGWLRVLEVSDRAMVDQLSFWLDRGESEVLTLARELGTAAAIDERRGRNIAVSLGIPQTGTVGILLAAKRARVIPSVKPLLDQLIASGVRLSVRLYEEALRIAEEE
jgi:predicted nucleic acid-binding protein